MRNTIKQKAPEKGKNLRNGNQQISRAKASLYMGTDYIKETGSILLLRPGFAVFVGFQHSHIESATQIGSEMKLHQS
jgi:hypothetical protein